jgi:sec-independent protein translocase protein TatA
MPFSIGPLELVVVLIIAFAIFGAKRVPQLARSVGTGVHELRGALNPDRKEENAAEAKHPPAGGERSGSDSPRD